MQFILFYDSYNLVLNTLPTFQHSLPDWFDENLKVAWRKNANKAKKNWLIKKAKAIQVFADVHF